MKHWHVALALVALGSLLGCTGAETARQGVNEAAEDTREGRVAEARESLEILREDYPDDFEVRIQLAEVYYQKARLALETGDEAEYLRFLGAAQDELIAAVAIDPASAAPHTWMGIVAAYQGDLDRALESFSNARRLEPRDWVAYTNIAQTMTYRDNVKAARKFLERARQVRADPTVILLNECLIEWREGSLEDAEWLFEEAYELDPETVNTWDAAPVSDPIRGFDDFTSYCCANPACGPYMVGACASAELDVVQREVPEETALRELQIEMERRRALERIYKDRQDLRVQIEVGDDADPAEGDAAE